MIPNSKLKPRASSVSLSNVASTTVLDTNGIYWMLVETGLALIAVNLPLLYGSLRHEGIESVVLKMRSFPSLRSQGSNHAGSSKASKASKASSARNASIRFHDRSNRSELVYGMQKTSDSKATRTDSLGPGDAEEGKINITNTYSVT